MTTKQELVLEIQTVRPKLKTKELMRLSKGVLLELKDKADKTFEKEMSSVFEDGEK